MNISHGYPLIVHLIEDGQGYFLGRRPHIQGRANAGGTPIGTGATAQQLSDTMEKIQVLFVEEGGKTDASRVGVKKKDGRVKGVDP